MTVDYKKYGLSEAVSAFVTDAADMGDGEVLLSLDCESVRNFCGALDGCGLKRIRSCGVGETDGAFYGDERGDTVYVYTNARVPLARAVLGAKPCADTEPLEHVYFETVFHQVYNDPRVSGSMTYIIRLRDARFIIIDGGINYTGDDLLCVLGQLHPKKPEGEPYTVAAWIITHPHDDHIDLFKNILPREDIMSKLDIRRLIANIPASDGLVGVDDDVIPDNDYTRNTVFTGLARRGAEIVKPYAGMNIGVGELKFNFFYTQADWQSIERKTVNDASLVFSVTREGGRTVNILGDIMNGAARFIMKMYSEKSLKCYAVQVAHHAVIGPAIDFYELMEPRICFWPIPLGGYDYEYVDQYPSINERNRKMREMDVVNCLACFGPSQITI